MAIPSLRPRLSLAQQAISLRFRFPSAEVTLTSTTLTWTGIIRPTLLSRDYKVKMTYRYAEPPKIVTEEPLESRPGENLPHIYRGGSLCLYDTNEWKPDMLLADTIVPWAAEWLAHYELWKVRGHWYGDDEPSPVGEPVSSPSNEINNRAGRRREQQDVQRRSRRQRYART
jgi:hypothetical protein